MHVSVVEQSIASPVHPVSSINAAATPHWQDGLKSHNFVAKNTTSTAAKDELAAGFDTVKRWCTGEDLKHKMTTVAAVFAVSFVVLAVIKPPFVRHKTTERYCFQRMAFVAALFSAMSLLLPIGVPVGKKIYSILN